MRRKTVTVSSATSSPPIPVDFAREHTNIGLGVVVAAASTLTYKVQHTFDDIYAPGWSAGSANWFDHEFLVSKTVSDDGSYAFPVTAIRLTVTAYTVGSASLTVIQPSG